MGRLKKLKLTILRHVFNQFYQLCYHLRGPQQKRVVFATMRNTELADNLKALHHQFEQAEFDYDIRVLCFHYDRSRLSKLGFVWASLRSLYDLATAELFIIDDYFFPLYAVNKHADNQVIQLWHAIGSLKKFGLSLPGAQHSVIKPHTNYDWVLINAEADKPAYTDAFDIDASHVLALGSPMLDQLATQSLTVSHRPQRLLYAPTYRKGNAKAVTTYIRDFLKASQDLTEPWELYVSVHPYLKLPALQGSLAPNIHLFQDPEQVKQLLPTIDVFITDYSSLSLTFSYFERPILLFTPDYATYRLHCGFYVDYYHYLGAPHYAKATQVIAAINQQVPTLDLSYVKQLKQRTFPHQDGHNSQRVFDFLTNLI
ncbi:ribitolphosphotransferase [Lactobacillus sp.] [Lactiplantibacillus mudanjiangensis]|uniref:CDP-glycerol glycerophosphotransferase family protein n=1 Tax=Lactiplantibacillus mudanjiangensis TaxID=1296538 RepID=UPI0010145F40|nr:CDP-glycerol glycerophosphotransferase family protein [Lactiplantibacillus mudanjiangensis]VDG30884.1 ribitolphosphotransferase [Lactobacillus sp.] [Lactiplantibacillus mudanjiangensis]